MEEPNNKNLILAMVLSALVMGVSVLMLNFIFDHRRHTNLAATETAETTAVSASPSS